LHNVIQSEIAKRKKAEDSEKKAENSEKKLMGQFAAVKASALSAGNVAAASGEADHLAVRKLREELKATQLKAAQETRTLQDQLRRLQQAVAKAQSQAMSQAKTQQSRIQLRNQIASSLAAEMKDQKAKAELSDQKAKAELSQMAAEMSHQKTIAAASEAAAESRVQTEEAELKSELAAAKASSLSANRAAAAATAAAKASSLSANRAAAVATAQAAAKSKADREEMSKLREEFKKEMGNLKQTEAESKKSQNLAKQETTRLRHQLRQLQQASATSPSQPTDQSQKPMEVAATTPTNTKAINTASPLGMMSAFFATR